VNLDQLYHELAQPPKALGVLPMFWALRPRFQFHWLEQVDSTNRALADLLAAGAPAGTVVVASTQQAGRGQWGRQWQSLPGGLYLSLGLKPDLAVQRSLYLTLASAWGVATSLRNLGLAVQVKWPNDLVVQGKKLGGILTETRVGGSQIHEAVIGLGLNGYNPVPTTGISIQQLIQPEHAPTPLKSLEGLAAVALYGLLQGYLYWQSQGDEVFLKAYQQQMTHVGKTIVVGDHPTQIIGVAPSGNLHVRPFYNHQPGDTPWEIEPGKVTLGYNA
jgi:BirA family biotin operon repressor/biotin-[acetyl-CoA-carboxylase] ligase